MTQRTLSPDRVGETEKRPRAVLLLTSGRRLDLLNSDPQAWTDEDLAAGLARTLRSWRRVAMGPPAQCRSAQPDRARHPRGRRPALCGRGASRTHA